MFLSISTQMSDDLWQRDACEQFGMVIFFRWHGSFWRRTAVCSLTVNWPALSYKYLNKIWGWWRCKGMWTLTEAAGGALVMDVAVLTRLNIFGVFVFFLKMELQFGLYYICVSWQTGLLLNILKWVFCLVFVFGLCVGFCLVVWCLVFFFCTVST